MRLPQVIVPKALVLVLQDKCFGKNYSSFLDFTLNYEGTSGIFVPCSSKTYVVGAHKNRLNETVLLSTQNIC